MTKLAGKNRVFHLFAAALSAALSIRAQPPTNTDVEHAQGTNLGIYTFTGRCAGCHDMRKEGAPDRYTLNRLTPEEIYQKMTVGSMAPHAKGLSELEMRVVAVYVGGRPFGAAAAGDASRMKNLCANKPASGRQEIDRSNVDWNGWGYDPGNSRFQRNPGLTPERVSRMRLKWAFGFPSGNSAYGQPSVVNGRVFVGADTGFVYSLDAVSGCIYWSFKASAGVRTAVSAGPGAGPRQFLAYFGDVKGNVYAVDAQTGREVWRQRADTHPIARITGTPKLVEGRLYVP